LRFAVPSIVKYGSRFYRFQIGAIQIGRQGYSLISFKGPEIRKNYWNAEDDKRFNRYSTWVHITTDFNPSIP
jgi:hypothetical protein